MRSAGELLRRVELGRDSFLELKEVRIGDSRVSAPSRNELADKIAAMANSGGGILVLGVRDRQREILGIPSGHTATVERFVTEVGSSSIEPPLKLQTCRVELPDSAGDMRAVLQVAIPRSLFVHKSPGGYFRRQGSSKRELPPQELTQLFRQRRGAGLIAFDEEPVSGTGAADLDEALYRPLLRSSSGDLLRDLHKLR
ncbi:MAG: ATP-binding protein, partial [Gammaproteobacteria bacterium]|nr:ATP-binding protein [Gammaproteobacteria bacterium]